MEDVPPTMWALVIGIALVGLSLLFLGTAPAWTTDVMLGAGAIVLVLALVVTMLAATHERARPHTRLTRGARGSGGHSEGPR